MEGHILTDIRIPFWRLVLILVKWAFAAIPAAIIVTIILGIIGWLIAAIFGNIPVSFPPTPTP